MEIKLQLGYPAHGTTVFTYEVPGGSITFWGPGFSRKRGAHSAGFALYYPNGDRKRKGEGQTFHRGGSKMNEALSTEGFDVVRLSVDRIRSTPPYPPSSWLKNLLFWKKK